MDFEDVDSFERQVFMNIRNFRLEFDTEEMNNIYNTTDAKTIERIFEKTFDMLVDKKRIDDIQIFVHLHITDITLLEKFIDCVESFLNKYNESMDEGRITIKLEHTTDYKEEIEYDRQIHYRPGLGLGDRFDQAFDRLSKSLPRKHYNFKIIIVEIES